MSPMHGVTELLRQLPPPVRTGIYWAAVLVGALLGGLQGLGVETLGSVTVARALEIYAYVVPLTGVLAVANVGNKPAAATEYDELEEPTDLSSFEPVGNPDDVYGQYVV